MKHQNHTTRNILIIFAALAIIIVGGLYFWREEKSMYCKEVCTTIDEERSCTDVCTAKK